MHSNLAYELSFGQPSMSLETDESPINPSHPDKADDSPLDMENADPERSSQNSKMEELQDGHVVDWEGSEDPNNPMNWPTLKKGRIIALVSLMTFLS